MAEPGDICVYCAQPVLTGEERPEHAIPAALGASLCVDAVCDPCNAWAGREVDQPFLEDAWVREHRSQSGVIDPRRGRKAQPVRSPLLQGVTEDGDFIVLDRDGRPKMRPRIVELGDGRFEIRANSAKEARRLQRRVERRAAAAGKTGAVGVCDAGFLATADSRSDLRQPCCLAADGGEDRPRRRLTGLSASLANRT